MSLLGLVMIVKDEGRGIVATLESIRPWIDNWLIIDTGSTDRTKELIQDTMAGIPGELIDEPFVDFGVTRNRALELFGDRSEYALMLSGDDIFVGGHSLREFCKTHPQDGGYFVKMDYAGCVYDFGCLIRRALSWRYAGAVHEVLVGPGLEPPPSRVPNCHIKHTYFLGDNEMRWERDKKILFDELAKDSSNPRTVFYLAQTHECLGELQAAMDLYRLRVAMGGWIEEHYEALFRRGRVGLKMGLPWSQVQEYYLEAFARDPRRAEPLCAIAEHYRDAGNHALAYVFAHAGATIPHPLDVQLFVDPIARWKCLDIAGIAAYYIGRFEQGEAALKQAIDSCPDQEKMTHLLHNVKFYADRRAA